MNDPIITNFMEIYFPKVKTNLLFIVPQQLSFISFFLCRSQTTSKIQIPRLLDSICKIITSKENYEDLCGDLLTICVIVQAFGIPATIRSQLLNCLNTIKTRFKDEFEEGESLLLCLCS